MAHHPTTTPSAQAFPSAVVVEAHTNITMVAETGVDAVAAGAVVAVNAASEAGPWAAVTST